MEIVKATFRKFAATELTYKEIEGGTENDVLEDIYLTSLWAVATRN